MQVLLLGMMLFVFKATHMKHFCNIKKLAVF